MHLNHVQIVTAVCAIPFQSDHYCGGLAFECVLMIRLCFNVSSEKFKFLSPQIVFFILPLMALNDDFFGAQRVTNFRANTVYMPL